MYENFERIYSQRNEFDLLTSSNIDLRSR